MRPRVLISRPLPAKVVSTADRLFECEHRVATTPMSPAEMRAALALFDGVLPTLGDQFSAEVFQDFDTPRCRILANFGVGYNHIDVAAARSAGIEVTNTPGAVTEATADIAVMLMLMSCRRASEGEALARSGNWKGWHPTQMLGLHLSGKTVGILGMGRIGQAIARRCHAGFRMQVAYWNRSAKDPGFAMKRAHSPTELAAISDVLVVALPGGSETRHLVNADVLQVMRPHAHLVNIARGEIIEETALIAALQAKQIAGAGLDVYEHEPCVPEVLRSMQNVTLLPHLGTATHEVRENMGMMAIENLRAFFAGEVPENRVY